MKPMIANTPDNAASGAERNPPGRDHAAREFAEPNGPDRDRGEPEGAGPERPARRDAARNRQKILDAAREVFARRGLKAGLNEVAHHAGLGVGTVYRHFPDKNALIDAVLQERVVAVLAVVERELANPDAGAGLKRVLRTIAEMHAADLGLRDAVFGTAHEREQMLAMRARIAPRMEQLLARARAEGAVRDDITLGDVMILMFLVTELARDRDATYPDAYRRYLELFLDALRPGDLTSPLPPPVDDREIATLVDRWIARSH